MAKEEIRRIVPWHGDRSWDVALRALAWSNELAIWARGLLVNENRREHYVGLTAVVVVHLVAIWILAINLEPLIGLPEPKETPISLVVLGAVVAPHPTAQPELVDPTLPVVDPPGVEIEQEQGPAAISAADISMLLAPRPDPVHLNTPLSVPPAASGAIAGLKVVLKVLVKTDGVVGDAQISKSCGFGDLDAAAIRYVKDNWRFIPAMLGNRPVEDWTTVFVPLVSGG